MKKIIIFLIPFLLTGCADVTYDLEINSNLEITESINMSATKEYFANFYLDSPLKIVEGSFKNEELLKPLIDNEYKYELRENNRPYPSVFATKKYNSLEQYAANTVFKNQVFEEIFISTDDNFVTLKTKGFIEYRPDDSGGENYYQFPVSNLLLNIKLPFSVKETNADKIDKKANTYTWLVNEKTKEKEIIITFDKNTKNIIFDINLYIPIIIFIVGILSIIYIIKKIEESKKNNSLY